MSGWLGQLAAKSPIAADGSEVAVFLCDGTRFRLKVTRQTTAGAVCVAIADKLGLELDGEYGLYTCTVRDDEHGGRFSHVKDAMTVADAVKKWPASDLAGSPRRRLYFKRKVYVIDSEVDCAEDGATASSNPLHHLAFAEAAFNFVECNYRFPEPNATEMSALLLHSLRGPFSEERDTPEAILDLVEDVVPRYLLTDRTDVAHTTPAGAEAKGKSDGLKDVAQRLAAGALAGRRWASGEVYRRVGCVDTAPDGATDGGSEASMEAMAVTREQAADRLLAEYRALAGSSRFHAEHTFLQRVKEFVAYGSDIFVGKRTWRANEADATEEAVMERTEDVTVCVGYSGVVFTGLTHPLGCEEHKFDSITKWTLSEDSRVFAFQVEEPAEGQGMFKFVVYIVTDQAPEVEQSVDRFVDALVAKTQGKLTTRRDRSTVGKAAECLGMDARPLPDCAPGGVDPWAAGDGAAASASASASAAAADAAGEEAPASPSAASAASGGTEEAPLPAGWVKMFDDDGDAYYYNEETDVTQWERPEPDGTATATAEGADDDEALPEGWTAMQDEDGDTYYCHDDGRTQWDRPTA